MDFFPHSDDNWNFQGFLKALLCIVFLFPSFLSAQQLVTILDGETQEPLIGVSVYTEDMSTFTGTTDFDGKIKLPNLSYREIINFTYVGYRDMKVPFFELRKSGGIVKMLVSQSGLDTLVIIGRKDEVAEEIPYQSDRISAKELAFKNPQTTADALAAEAGVYVQKSQMGGGSPVLRGFEANRVLLVVDGIKMNNAIYRNGHLQNSITIDNSMLEQIEVIYGPGSLTYGSDALGGVVHFRTRDPKLLFGSGNGQGYRMNSNIFGRLSTANLEKTVHYDLDYGNSSWGSLTSISYSTYDDLRAGAQRPTDYPDIGKKPFYAYRNGVADEVIVAEDANIQHGTGYNQLDLLQKIKIKLGKEAFLILNGQYSTSSNVPRYDRLVDTLSSADLLKYSDWYYGPQERILTSMRFNLFKSNALFDKATIIASYQNLDEDRFSRRFGRNNRTWNSEDVTVYSFTADFNKDLDENGQHRIGYGVDAGHNVVASTVREQSIISNRLSPGRELSRYPSAGASMTSYGGYLNYRWANQAKTLFFDTGLRFTNVSVFGKYETSDLVFINWDESFLQGIENTNKNISWAAGLTWNSKNDWQFRALASKAFRAPNVDDIFKNRIKNDKAVLPNVNLTPETALSTEVTLGKTFSNSAGFSWQLSGTGFYTQLKDAIVRRDGTTPDGATTVEGDGGQSLFDVQQNFNASEAFIYGASLNSTIKLNAKWTLSGGYNYTYGRTAFEILDDAQVLLDTLTPMDHIPPVYGKASLGYQGEKWRIEGVYRFNGKKALEEYAVTGMTLDESGKVVAIDRTGSADNLEEAGTCKEVIIDGQRTMACEGALAWSTLNLYTSFQLGKKITIDFAAENILDTHYRPFASGVSAPGRNFILTLRAQF